MYFLYDSEGILGAFTELAKVQQIMDQHEGLFYHTFPSHVCQKEACCECGTSIFLIFYRNKLICADYIPRWNAIVAALNFGIDLAEQVELPINILITVAQNRLKKIPKEEAQKMVNKFLKHCSSYNSFRRPLE